MINWKLSERKPPKKIKMLDECSHGQLWLCELAATIAEEMNLYGGLIKWFFLNLKKKNAGNYLRWINKQGFKMSSYAVNTSHRNFENG